MENIFIRDVLQHREHLSELLLFLVNITNPKPFVPDLIKKKIENAQKKKMQHSLRKLSNFLYWSKIFVNVKNLFKYKKIFFFFTLWKKTKIGKSEKSENENLENVKKWRWSFCFFFKCLFFFQMSVPYFCNRIFWIKKNPLECFGLKKTHSNFLD